MAAFTKLFSSIVTSTIWQEDDKTRIVWITMLATADANGRVEGSIPGLAHIAHVSIEDCERALQRLMAPDPYSRTRDHEGRRIAEIDGGWQILNYAKYREQRDPEKRREQVREAVRRHRAKTTEDVCNPNVIQSKPRKAQAEAEAEAEEEEDIAIAEDDSRWDSCKVALREAYGKNKTIENFIWWMGNNYLVRRTDLQIALACARVQSLIKKSKTADKGNPPGWFIGAVKRPESDDGFGYRPIGRAKRSKT